MGVKRSKQYLNNEFEIATLADEKNVGHCLFLDEKLKDIAELKKYNPESPLIARVETEITRHITEILAGTSVAYVECDDDDPDNIYNQNPMGLFMQNGIKAVDEALDEFDFDDDDDDDVLGSDPEDDMLDDDYYDDLPFGD